VVQERTAVLDHLEEDALNRLVSQRRIVVEVADELSTESPYVIDVLLDGPRRQIRRRQMFRKWLEQCDQLVGRAAGGSRSFSSPIHDRGQPFKSRQ
jgi:hypothetical protein